MCIGLLLSYRVVCAIILQWEFLPSLRTSIRRVICDERRETSIATVLIRNLSTPQRSYDSWPNLACNFAPPVQCSTPRYVYGSIFSDYSFRMTWPAGRPLHVDISEYAHCFFLVLQMRLSFVIIKCYRMLYCTASSCYCDLVVCQSAWRTSAVSISLFLACVFVQYWLTWTVNLSLSKKQTACYFH